MAVALLKRRVLRAPLIVGALLFGAFALWIDDWGRDFTAHRAEIAPGSSDPTLRPLRTRHTVDDLVVGLEWAGKRIGGFELVGTASERRDSMVVFVRSGRLLPFLKQDIRMRVRDRGTDRIITGESESRWRIGDLGRNPRNLRRVMAELKLILDGAEVPR